MPRAVLEEIPGDENSDKRWRVLGRELTVHGRRVGLAGRTLAELPLVSVSNACLGDLEHAGTSWVVHSVKRSWTTARGEILVLSYGKWMVRDGCEGRAEYLVIHLSSG